MQNLKNDKETIDNLVLQFFGIFNNKGRQPDWQRMHQLCLPQTIIVKKSEFREEVYTTLHTFIEPRKKILSDGTLTDFEEEELESETKIIGSIAQRSSFYRKSGMFHGAPFDERGNKFFQFIKTIEGWRISAVIWEDETAKR